MKVVIQTKWGRVEGDLHTEGPDPQDVVVLAREAGFTRFLSLRNAKSPELGVLPLVVVNREDVLTIGTAPEQEGASVEAPAPTRSRSVP